MMKKLVVCLLWPALALALTCRAAAAADVFDAVRAGDVEKVKALLQADPKLAEARTEDGNTPLHIAALEGHAAIAQVLLDQHAQVNARGLRQETPLHMAMYEGRREMAELLLANQADVNARSASGETPLHIAARKGHRELVELLLTHRADINARDQQDQTPLHLAAAGAHAEVVKLLVEHGADLQARDKSGRTARATAIENGDAEIIELLTPRVGAYGDVRRLAFEGVTSFTPDKLRLGLQYSPEFYEISHPFAPLDACLEAVEKRLQLGYQHQGFLEAQVAVQAIAKTGEVKVKVTEGPRYVCGAVKITGVKNMPAEAIIARLTRAPDSGETNHGAFAFKDKAPSSHALDASGPDLSRLTDAYWTKGEHVPGSEFDLQWMKALVDSALHAHGFLYPKVNVSLAPDQASRVVDLQVEVVEEGITATVDRIEVVGNQKNATEAIARYLGVQPGALITGDLTSGIEDKLWRSARFLEYKVRLGTPDTSGRTPLQIEVAEYADAPPLGEKFTATGEAMLKLREWLSKLGESREDMVLSLVGSTNTSWDLEVVLSPLNGLALVQGDPSHAAKTRTENAAVLKGGMLGLYSLAGGRKLQLPCPDTQLWSFLTLTSQGPSTNPTPFNTSIGAGFHSREKQPPYDVPYQFNLTLAPVACLGIDHGMQFTDTFDGVMLVRSNSSTVFKINTRTGRIVDLRLADENTHLQLHFEPNAFTRLLKQIEADTAKLPDVCDTNAALSSALAFLAEEVLASRHLGSFLRETVSSDASSSMPELVKQLKLAGILLPLQQLVPASDPGDTNYFWVPEDPAGPSGSTDSLFRLVAGWLLQHSDQLAEPGHWPWQILREAALVVQGSSKYTDQTLTQIYQSRETGPLGYWTTAALMARVQHPQARKFAARGLERLSAEDFARDCRVLLTGNSAFSQCFQKLATSLAALKDEQVAALVERASPANAQFIRDCVRRLREAKGQPPFDVIAPALDVYWQSELKGVVAAALQRQSVDPTAAYEEAVKIYEGEDKDRDYARAAKLFQQAADAGHPGAQYYLGILYMKGQGVPKNPAAASEWYRAAAMNGSVRAAMELGDLFGDGIDRQADPVSAFVWYGVAAARGHKVAPMLRDSQRRKLTPAQAAEAEKQVKEILARKAGSDGK